MQSSEEKEVEELLKIDEKIIESLMDETFELLTKLREISKESDIPVITYLTSLEVIAAALTKEKEMVMESITKEILQSTDLPFMDSTKGYTA